MPAPAPQPSALARYGVAAVGVAAVVAIRLAAWPLLSDEIPWILFAPVILIAAWYGGLGPGLAATLLSAFATVYFLLEPYHTLGLHTASEVTGFTVFAFTGALISWLVDRARRAQAEREELLDEVRDAYQRLQERTEELAAANDDLHASSEELAAANEELQAQSEEMACANEELQSQQHALTQALEETKRAQDALRESEEDLNRAQAVAQTGSWRLDVRRNELRWSNETYRIFGVPQGTPLTYEAFLSAIHPDDRESVDRSWTAALGGEPYDIEHRIVVGDQVKWVRERAAIEFDAQGVLRGGFGTVQDITEIKRVEDALRASEANYRAIFNAANDAIFVHDLETGAFLDANQKTTEMYGYTPQEIRALDVEALSAGVPPYTQDQALAWIGKAAQGEPQLFEWLAKNRSGSPFWVEVNLKRAPISGHDRLLAVVRDISERKRVQQALQAANDGLREADRRKDEFLAMLSHELRNPLAAISSAVQLLQSHGGGDVIAQRARDIADRQVWHMKRLIDDLLDVARITRGQIDLRKEEVALAQVLESAIETARPTIDANRQSLSVSLPRDPLPLHADKARLIQVFANILDNAAKYTPAGGHIRLSAERAGDEALVRIRDDGHGITADLLPHVFDLFVQDERPLARSDGGLGIGLTVVRRLVEMHAGTIVAHSDGPDKGSEFIVRLPLFDGPAGAAPCVEPTTPNARRRVLLVEDNPDTAEITAMVLEQEGHEAAIAHDGPAAVEIAQRCSPDVIILDIGLPGMDGYELAKRLRGLPELAHTQFVALTGYARREDIERARAAGFDHHLAKPVRLEALRRVLAQTPVP